MFQNLLTPNSKNKDNGKNSGKNNNGKEPAKFDLPKGDTLDLVPIAAICDPFLVTKEGAFIQMFEIPPLENAVSSSEKGGERSYWINQYGQALSNLPPGTQFQVSIQLEPTDPLPDLTYFSKHKKRWYEESRIPDISERKRAIAGALCEASDVMLQTITDWFEERRPVTMKTIITISWSPPNIVETTKALFSGKRNTKKTTLSMSDLHGHLPKAKEFMNEKGSIIMSAFGGAQIPLRPLNYQEMCQAVWRSLHPISTHSIEGSAAYRAQLLSSGADLSQIGPPPLESFTPQLSSEELANLLAPDTVVEEADHIIVDDVYLSGYVVNDFQPNRMAGVHELSRLQGGWSGTMFVEVAEPHLVADQLRQREVQLSAQEGAKSSKGILNNYHSIQERNTVQSARIALETASVAPIYIRFFVMRSASNLETLHNYRRATESAFKTSGTKAFLANRTQQHLLLSCAPTDRLYMNQVARNMDAGSLSTFFWPRRIRSFEEKGIYVGLDTNSKLPVRIDPFGARNDKTPTYLILGKPGAGKSVLLKTEMVAALMDGGNVMAIDLEGEMEEFTRYYGGKYIHVGSSAPDAEKINVLDIPPDIDDPLAAGTEHLVSFVSSVLNRTVPHGPEWNALATAYLQVFEKMGCLDENYNLTDWRSEDAPLLSDIVTILGRMQGDNGVGRSLAQMLEPYAKGVFSKQFNYHTTFDIRDEKLVVFNLKDVNESNSIQRMRVYLWQIMGWIWGEVLRRHAVDPETPNHIMIDEVWKLLSAPGGAASIENMARRSRKRMASLWMATQESSEFINSQEGMTILSIVGNKFIMAQEPIEAERLKHILNLSSGVAEFITGLTTGSGLLITPEGMHQIYVAVPPEWRTLKGV